MRPRRRYLDRNAGTEGPTSLLFFDSESWMEKASPTSPRTEGRLRLWSAAYVRRDGDTWRPPVWHRGTTAGEFWDLVERLSSWSRPLWAFAHNLGWDLTQLSFWDELERWRWTAGPVERECDPDTGTARRPWMGRMCLESRPTFLVLRGKRGTLKLIDSGNYWPTKLAAIGESFGVPKLPMPDPAEPDSTWWTYCDNDVDVCRVAICELIRWWVKEDCGVFQMTAPSLAMRNYQHTGTVVTATGHDCRIVLEDDSPARGLERDAYLGGRIEPFYSGCIRGPIYKLDCNSLYPAVMTNRLYPRKRAAPMHGCRPYELARKMTAWGAIANVTVNTGPDGDTYPVRREGLQVHACGRFNTSLAGPELKRALDRGHVERIGEAWLYSLADLFTTWSEKWLRRKLEAQAAGNVGELEFVKLVLNSLYGKFAQRGDWWCDAPERAPRRGWGRVFRIHVQSEKVIEWRYVAGHMQRKEPGREPGNAFPAISAYVTAYAREHMRRYFEEMPERSLLYTGTDSIICTQAGHDALMTAGAVDPTKPGLMRLERVYGEMEVNGPNWYRLDDEWTASGLKGKAYVGPDGRLMCDLWDSLGGLMGRNPKGRCGFKTVELVDLFASQKNSPTPDGWRVPYRFSEDADFSDRPVRSRSPAVPREF